MSGVRTSKTVNGTTYNYTTLSGKVMRQTWGSKSLEFIYDDGNQPFAMIYNDGSTSTLYYYVLNAQGDVIALLNANGTLAASYNYGAWGSCTVYNSSDAAIGDLNPLRYRSYYYDAETGFYYLQSRYYDFANCRFINADTFATTDANGFLSANMFAYCQNNPIALADHDGNSATIVGAVLGFVFTAADALISGASIDQAFWCGVSGAVTGAISGFVADTAIATGGMSLGVVAAAGAVNGIASAANTFITQKILKQKTDTTDIFVSGAVGFGVGILGTAVSDAAKPVAKGISSGIKYVKKQLVTEMSAISTGIGRRTLRTLRWDAAYSVVTNFGSWLHSKAFGKILHSLRR